MSDKIPLLQSNNDTNNIIYHPVKHENEKKAKKKQMKDIFVINKKK